MRQVIRLFVLRMCLFLIGHLMPSELHHILALLLAILDLPKLPLYIHNPLQTCIERFFSSIRKDQIFVNVCECG
jgi:hypothetical protein